ncbi:MAG: DUF4388 domain-containing protein [Deltaproteobacteria bacterium]
MAKIELRSQPDPRSTTDGSVRWGTVADAILTSCNARDRRALCVTGSKRTGRLFVEHQRVVHAEYGDESGLAALVEMLRAGRVRLSAWNGAWPSRRTLRLGPLALFAQGAVPGAPPPLPAEVEGSAPPDAFDGDERTRLWSRWATTRTAATAARASEGSADAPSRAPAALPAQAPGHGQDSGAANDFRSSGVFRRSAAGKPSELAPLPSWPDVALAAERNQISELPAALFTGALTELGLADVVQILQWLRRSAIIRITRDELESHIWCESGEIIDAESGRLRGEAAVYRALNFEQGTLFAELRPSQRARTIFAPTHRLVLEAARRKDVSVALRRALGDEHRRCRCAGKRTPPGLRTEELALLRSFSVARSAHDAMQSSELGDFETLRLLARWIQTGDLIPVGLRSGQE